MLRQSATAVVLFSLVLAASSADAGNPNPGVLPPHSNAFGKTYGEWAGEWWNWGLQFPSATNPIMDTTGEFGHLGQEGPVWFLAGNFGGTTQRQLTVPTGKALFFPIVNTIWLATTPGETEEEIRAGANADIDGTSVLECTVDGIPLEGLFDYRAESPPGGFVLYVAGGSVLTEWGFEPGDYPYPTVADGYWLMLAPLSKGEHDIQFHGVKGDFGLDVTYDLNVVGGKAAHGVPEPSAIALASFGLLGVAAYGWRRRRRMNSQSG